MMSRKTEDKYNEKMQNQKIYSFTSKVVQRERQETEFKNINRSDSIKMHFAASLKSKSILPTKIEKLGTLSIRKMNGMQTQRKLPLKMNELCNPFSRKGKSLVLNRNKESSSHKMMLAKRQRYNNVISSHLKHSVSQKKKLKYKLIRNASRLSLLKSIKLQEKPRPDKEYINVYLTQRRV